MTTPEQAPSPEPNWKPLELALRKRGLPVDRCREWMWMVTKYGMEFYKNIDSRQYVGIEPDGTRDT